MSEFQIQTHKFPFLVPNFKSTQKQPQKKQPWRAPFDGHVFGFVGNLKQVLFSYPVRVSPCVPKFWNKRFECLFFISAVRRISRVCWVVGNLKQALIVPCFSCKCDLFFGTSFVKCEVHSGCVSLLTLPFSSRRSEVCFKFGTSSDFGIQIRERRFEQAMNELLFSFPSQEWINLFTRRERASFLSSRKHNCQRTGTEAGFLIGALSRHLFAAIVTQPPLHVPHDVGERSVGHEFRDVALESVEDAPGSVHVAPFDAPPDFVRLRAKNIHKLIVIVVHDPASCIFLCQQKRKFFKKKEI